jgi:hypothetical protein
MGPVDPLHNEPICGGKYPTRLKDGLGTLAHHDDWSCLDDAETAGLLTNKGTGLYRVYDLTPRGKEVAVALHFHKIGGGSIATFHLPTE